MWLPCAGDGKEGEVDHLIMDMGDIDRERVIKEYKMIQHKENGHPMEPKINGFRKSNIVITALDYNPYEDPSQASSKAHKKQLIRDKAVALLQKVKSEEKLPMF